MLRIPPVTFVAPEPAIELLSVFVPPVTFKVPVLLIAALLFALLNVTLFKFTTVPEFVELITDPAEFGAPVILTLFNVRVLGALITNPV